MCGGVHVCTEVGAQRELLVINEAAGVGKITWQGTLSALRWNLVFLPPYSLYALKVILMVDISYMNKDKYVFVHFKYDPLQDKI